MEKRALLGMIEIGRKDVEGAKRVENDNTIIFREKVLKVIMWIYTKMSGKPFTVRVCF